MHSLLGWATLLPLFSFFIILCTGHKIGRRGGFIAVGAIAASAVLSFTSLGMWCTEHFPQEAHHGEHAEEGHASSAAETNEAETNAADTTYFTATALQGHHANEGGSPSADHSAATGHDADVSHAEQGEHSAEAKPKTGVYYTLGRFGDLEINISYYIDSLTVLMFSMVTLIATCIHVYALGYMHDEEHEITDHEVTLSDGHHLHRAGRFPRFFQYLSLFCFSMLGLVLAGNIAMVFVFWELVGICSYFLIGFYVERKSASTAANKAFIVNRVGDFGFIIGLLALWSTLGTFAFGDLPAKDAAGNSYVKAGIFSQLRPGPDHELRPADSMVLAEADAEYRALFHQLRREHGTELTDAQLHEAVASQIPAWRERRGWLNAPYGHWLLIIAGLGIFCGCVGKSAQFPLHTWLPDAMEGPTPVSALVHSATMVAAGVYLVGRFYPVFTPEVLWVIAIIGCITLFMAATIAVTATDIKRVLAYSTVSQLGYMMLALGVGGWLAGMMHLVTHAFFKSLLFLCSGSVIHAVHTNEMTEMGGLWKKMPITALTMLIGCLAIAGAGIPFVIGFSGYYSKDLILEQAFSLFRQNGPGTSLVFFVAAAGGAAITSFYMFRMWYMTFAGKPRDHHRYDHAHESPAVMWVPLAILAVFAIGVAWHPREALYFVVAAAVVWLVVFLRSTVSSRPQGQTMMRLAGLLVVLAIITGVWSWRPLVLENLIAQGRPVGTLPTTRSEMLGMTWPTEPASHAYAVPITLLAFGTALGGFLLATAMYGLGVLNPEEVRRQFSGVYTFLRNKWWFDELYDALFVRPTMVLSQMFARVDKRLIDRFIDGLAAFTTWFSRRWDALADRGLVDGFVNAAASWTYSIGISLRSLQTGQLRQYVMFIVLGTISIFLLISMFWNPSLAR